MRLPVRVWETRVQPNPQKRSDSEAERIMRMGRKKSSPQALQTVLPSGSRLHRGLSVTPQFEQRGWLGDRTPDEKLSSSVAPMRAYQNRLII